MYLSRRIVIQLLNWNCTMIIRLDKTSKAMTSLADKIFLNDYKKLTCCSAKSESTSKMRNYLKWLFASLYIRTYAQTGELIWEDFNNEFGLESNNKTFLNLKHAFKLCQWLEFTGGSWLANFRQYHIFFKRGLCFITKF